MTPADAVARLHAGFEDLGRALSERYLHVTASVPVVVSGEDYGLSWDGCRLMFDGPDGTGCKSTLRVVTVEALVCAALAAPTLLAALELGASARLLRLAEAEHALIETLKRVRASTPAPKEPSK